MGTEMQSVASYWEDRLVAELGTGSLDQECAHMGSALLMPGLIQVETVVALDATLQKLWEAFSWGSVSASQKWLLMNSTDTAMFGIQDIVTPASSMVVTTWFGFGDDALD